MNKILTIALLLVSFSVIAEDRDDKNYYYYDVGFGANFSAKLKKGDVIGGHPMHMLQYCDHSKTVFPIPENKQIFCIYNGMKIKDSIRLE